MGYFTELQAVNRMLTGNGERPVSSLTSGSGDVSLAQQKLDEARITEQRQGLWQNITIRDSVVPDASGYIEFSNEILSVTLVTQEMNPDCNVTLRGRSPQRLYDITNETDIWDSDTMLVVRIITALPFESLTTAQQLRVVDMAAAEYQAESTGDPSVDSQLRRRAALSRAEARADDMRQRQYSVFGPNSAEQGPAWGARRARRWWGGSW